MTTDEINQLVGSIFGGIVVALFLFSIIFCYIRHRYKVSPDTDV